MAVGTPHTGTYVHSTRCQDGITVDFADTITFRLHTLNEFRHIVKTTRALGR